MQRDGLMDESDDFLTRFGNGNAAGQVGHIGAVVTFSFLDDYYIHFSKGLRCSLQKLPGKLPPYQLVRSGEGA